MSVNEVSPIATYTFRVRAESGKQYSEWTYATFNPSAFNESGEQTNVAKSTAVSETFIDFFAEDEVEDEFWFELEKALNTRK